MCLTHGDTGLRKSCSFPKVVRTQPATRPRSDTSIHRPELKPGVRVENEGRFLQSVSCAILWGRAVPQYPMALGFLPRGGRQEGQRSKEGSKEGRQNPAWRREQRENGAV